MTNNKIKKNKKLVDNNIIATYASMQITRVPSSEEGRTTLQRIIIIIM